MTVRRSISPKVRVSLFALADGRCHICERRIRPGEKWDLDHRIPLALGGADDTSNLAPAHEACHRGVGSKTSADLTCIAKVKRIHAKHIGAKRPTGWQSKWKRKMNGTVVLR